MINKLIKCYSQWTLIVGFVIFPPSFVSIMHLFFFFWNLNCSRQNLFSSKYVHFNFFYYYFIIQIANFVGLYLKLKIPTTQMRLDFRLLVCYLKNKNYYKKITSLIIILTWLNFVYHAIFKWIEIGKFGQGCDLTPFLCKES